MRQNGDQNNQNGGLGLVYICAGAVFAGIGATLLALSSGGIAPGGVLLVVLGGVLATNGCFKVVSEVAQDSEMIRAEEERGGRDGRHPPVRNAHNIAVNRRETAAMARVGGGDSMIMSTRIGEVPLESIPEEKSEIDRDDFSSSPSSHPHVVEVTEHNETGRSKDGR